MQVEAEIEFEDFHFDSDVKAEAPEDSESREDVNDLSTVSQDSGRVLQTTGDGTGSQITKGPSQIIHNIDEQPARAACKPTAGTGVCGSDGDLEAPSVAAPRRDVAAEIASRLAAIEEEERHKAALLTTELETLSESDEDELMDLADLPKVSAPLRKSTRVVRVPEPKKVRSRSIAIPVAPGLQGADRFQAKLAQRALARKYLDEHDDLPDDGSGLVRSADAQTPLQKEISEIEALINGTPATTAKDVPEPVPPTFFEGCSSKDSVIRKHLFEHFGCMDEDLVSFGRWQRFLRKAVTKFGDEGKTVTPESLVLMSRMSADLSEGYIVIASHYIANATRHLNPAQTQLAVYAISEHIVESSEHFETHLVAVFSRTQDFLRRLSLNVLRVSPQLQVYEVGHHVVCIRQG
jgi:hypothetical protein